MKTYPITCPSCNGSGLHQIAKHLGTTAMTESCPACNGNKWVMCCDKRGDEPWPVTPVQYQTVTIKPPETT